MLLVAFGMSACDTQPDNSPTTEAATPAPMSNELQTRPAQLIARPKDEAELDRLILAGYTPHSDHLHAPGVKSCPLAQGNEAVM